MATGRFNLEPYGAIVPHAFITYPARPEGASGALLFSAGPNEETALFKVELDNYSSGLEIDLWCYMLSAISGKVDLEVEIMKVQNGDAAPVETGSFAAANAASGGTTVPGTIKYPFLITVTCANDDSPAAGKVVFYIRIRRDVDDANDTATGDLKLFMVNGRYTTT